MSEQNLNGPHIDPTLDEMSRKRMSQRVATDAMDQCRAPPGVSDGAGQRAGINVVAANVPGLRIA